MKTDLPVSHLLDLGGYCINNTGHPTSYNLSGLRNSRWRVDNILRDNTSSVPTENANWGKDEYWPVGRPFNSQFLQRLIDRAALGVPEAMVSEADAWSTTEELGESPVRP